jgi:RND family efflux transporter MFP subunit
MVVAPFEGRLEKALVAPGDVVSAGDVVARMDGREIRWELAGLESELNAASKKRDSALALQNAAAAQLAKLDMERLELKIRLLEHRAENLEVKSPIGGIVTSGDLEKAEGAPVTTGATLFEIAPLDRMIAEVAVPEAEIAHVRTGQAVRIRLDAYPRRNWIATLDRIQPRAEIRDRANVFVAELTLDNSDELLRPGMKGHAEITGPRRSLAWILFHKAWESVALALGW